MLEINAEDLQNQLVEFLKKIFHDAGFSKAIIGLSGGIDSATSAALSVKALGPGMVFPVLMPAGALNSQDVLDAMSVVERLGIPLTNVLRVDIKSATDEMVKIIKDPGLDQIRRGNLMARLRMAVLFDQAKKRQALVVGTENKSEQLLGYFTRFGDEASDVEPLRNLYKTQVRQLAKFLGLPQSVLSKAPTAGLWPEQTDEKELGFTYLEADQVLALTFDEHQTPGEIAKTGIDEEVITKVLGRVNSSAFKHRLPYLP